MINVQITGDVVMEGMRGCQRKGTDFARTDSVLVVFRRTI
jgi:hypothetical protein